MLSTLTLRELKYALEQAHPEEHQLFPEAASTERWMQIRKDERYSAFWEELEEQAVRIQENPAHLPQFSDYIVFGETGDNINFENIRTQLYAGLHTFSLLAMTDDGSEWKTGLENAIWSVCNEYSWVPPVHAGLYVNEYPKGIWDQPIPPRETIDLQAAAIGFTLAEIIYHLGHRLHPWVVFRAKEEIERRIFQVYFYDPVPQNWELKTNNWPAVCSSNIGAAAIYLTQDSERLAGMLWRVIGALRQYVSGFDEEGATPEGPVYWQYGFSNLVFFAELLKERTGGRINLLAEPKIEKIAKFPHYCMLSNGKVVNFSDAAEELRFHTGLFHRLRQTFPSLSLPPEGYQSNQASKPSVLWIEAIRLMLWTSDQPAAEATGTSDTQEGVEERIFAGNQWVISKVRQPDDSVAAFAAKGGHNQEPHNHNDLGHFILHAGGVNVLADIGIGVYTRQYFQPEHRYEMIQPGSHGHSVPIINGCRQGFGHMYRAEIVNQDITEDELLFELDLSKAYECPSLQRFTRQFLWRRPVNENSQLILTDQVTMHEPGSSFQEVFICGVEPQQKGPGQVAIGAVLMTFEANQWQVEVETQLTVAHPAIERTFYRLLLTRKEMSESFTSQFRFEIT
ncbi:heparinase II/III family protein [Paenibacillus roseipurpureus]|uniref:Heparinase II/III family protein n=1 Tax=Paenibacillus roseopurpureus TaxID=2918901 RepID=A0AA96LLA2_9BACL|nr:heparinase II/III family protein [Paenibacillus sp. MBLB1832]WNR43967.1 heparinase II/III family protein [Paenibacillus sp. MBLB1832]